MTGLSGSWRIYPLRAQFLRLRNSISRRMLLSAEDVEAELAAYSSDLDGQVFASEEPSFQEGEHKAELYSLFEDNLRSSQSDMAAFAVAALYHHWERSVKWLLAKSNPPIDDRRINKANFKELKRLLSFNDLSEACQQAFDAIELGRLIANVIKHGEGASVIALRGHSPDIFLRPWTNEFFDLPSGHGVNLIWVQAVHVDAVADAIDRFWSTLLGDSIPAMPPMTLESFYE